MLDENKYFAIKKLANDVRKENDKLFKSLEKESIDDAIKEKGEFIDSVMNNMESKFSDGEQGKEEKQVFRVNVLLPDDLDFFHSYSKDKNIRNLMNKYAVNIEDVMGKITELNVYGKYIEVLTDGESKSSEPKTEETKSEPKIETKGKEPKMETKTELKNDFVEEMANLSPKEAESLLDEIEGLSSSMAELDIPGVEMKSVNVEIEPEEVTEEDIMKEETPKKKETRKDKKDKKVTDEDTTNSQNEEIFEDITDVVSNFVDEYTKLKGQLNDSESKVEEYQKKTKDLEKELTTLKKNNMESANALNKMREEKELLKNENSELKKEVNELKDKIIKTTKLIKKIYNTIPKK